MKSKVTLVNQGVHFVHAVTLHIHECRNTQYCAQNKKKNGTVVHALLTRMQSLVEKECVSENKK